MRKFLDTVKVVLLCLVVMLLAGLSFYACEIVPMQECMDHGHSWAYCYRILNK